MSEQQFPQEFQRAVPVIRRLEAAGFEAYFVGGSVRDLLLGKKIHDVDIATSAYPQEVKGLFKRTIDVGIEHGTVLVLFDEDQYEITTFRTESSYQDYRRPDEVTFVQNLAEDLKRRDFTINALAMTQSGEIIDLFNGMLDLKAGVIKAVGNPVERFTEDALRMIRGLRFASQLDFIIEADTLQAITDHHELLSKISIERIQIEFTKLMSGQQRKKGLLPFLESECYLCCPGFKGKLSQLTHLANLNSEPLSEDAQVWLVTLKLLEIDEIDVRRFLSQWKQSNQMIKRVSLLLKGLNYRLDADWNNQWLFDLGKENVLLIEKTLIYFEMAGDLTAVLAAYQQLPIHQLQDLALSGKELLTITEKRPGPWLGELLTLIKTKVLANELPNTVEALTTFVRDNLEG